MPLLLLHLPAGRAEYIRDILMLEEAEAQAQEEAQQARQQLHLHLLQEVNMLAATEEDTYHMAAAMAPAAQAMPAGRAVAVEEDTAVAAVALAVLAAQLAATEDQEPMELPLREPTQDLEALGVVL
jgi:hypothetical protein